MLNLGVDNTGTEPAGWSWPRSALDPLFSAGATQLAARRAAEHHGHCMAETLVT